MSVETFPFPLLFLTFDHQINLDLIQIYFVSCTSYLLYCVPGFEILLGTFLHDTFLDTMAVEVAKSNSTVAMQNGNEINASSEVSKTDIKFGSHGVDERSQ